MSVPAQIPISGPYLANGSTTQFAYKFYLLFATDLQVYVGGALQQLNNAYTVTGVGNSQGGNVIFISAPANGLEVLIKRATPYTRQTDYADNGDLLADVVNDDFDRIWLALQEINANFSSSISKAVGGNWDAQSLRITNLLDATQPQDAATLNQLNTVNGSAGQSAQAAADSAAAAKSSENNASGSQQAAANSASAASVSAGNSADSANLAQKWAANPVGAEVISGKFSALHYASKSSDSATAAATSATNALTSATNASNSAGAASQSATSAKSDADRAQSANPDNQLKKANNLSDVADVSAARTNLLGPDTGWISWNDSTVQNFLTFKGNSPNSAYELQVRFTKESIRVRGILRGVPNVGGVWPLFTVKAFPFSMTKAKAPYGQVTWADANNNTFSLYTDPIPLNTTPQFDVRCGGSGSTATAAYILVNAEIFLS